MDDKVLGYLRLARAELLQEIDQPSGNREKSITITNIDTAILWRQEEKRLYIPDINEQDRE